MGGMMLGGENKEGERDGQNQKGEKTVKQKRGKP